MLDRIGGKEESDEEILDIGETIGSQNFEITDQRMLDLFSFSIAENLLGVLDAIVLDHFGDPDAISLLIFSTPMVLRVIGIALRHDQLDLLALVNTPEVHLNFYPVRLPKLLSLVLTHGLQLGDQIVDLRIELIEEFFVGVAVG